MNLKKYIGYRVTSDDPPEYQTTLTVGAHRFDIGIPFDYIDDAEWMGNMLEKALVRMVGLEGSEMNKSERIISILDDIDYLVKMEMGERDYDRLYCLVEARIKLKRYQELVDG